MQADMLHNGGEQSIDELLKQSFLDLDQTNSVNDELFDMAGENVFSQEWDVKIDPSREAQFVKPAAPRWPWYAASAMLVAGAGIFFVATNNNSTESCNSLSHSNGGNFTVKFSPVNSDSPLNSINIVSHEAQENNIEKDHAYAGQTKKNGVVDLSGKLTAFTQLNNEKQTEKDTRFTEVKNANEVKEVSAVSDNEKLVNANSNPAKTNVRAKLPVFTEAQQSDIRREVKKMALELAENLQRYYPSVPGVSASGYAGKAYHGPFNMKSTEVTVSEYMLFLHDLVVNGKEEEYEKARPQIDEVFGANLSAADKDFFTTYFSSAEYKNYPMVLITPEGAELYCKWLKEVITENTEGVLKKVEIRLPNAAEWERAATGGNTKAEFGTSTGKIKSLFGKHAMANFRDTQKRGFDFLGNNPGFSDNEDTDATNEELNFFTCHVRKYTANGYGLYNMSGNVSEMVIDKKGKVQARGGNWNSVKEFLVIKDKDFVEFPMGAQASPYIGFRPVINLD